MIEYLKKSGVEQKDYVITYAPQMINWNYSYICNLNCKHCYSRTRKSSNVAKIEDKMKIVKNIIENNIYWVNLGGGEPILESDIYEVINQLTQNKVYVSLSTNGKYMDTNTIKKLAKVNLNTISISLDNSNSKKHNDIRGYSDSYSHVMSAIDLCRENGISVTISTTITSENVDDIENIIKLAISKGCEAISLKRIKLTGNATDRSELELNKNQVEKLYMDIIKFKKMYKEIEMNFNYGEELIEGIDGGCACGRTSVAIMPNGDVIPCVYNDVMKLGNAIFDDLSDIFHSPKLEYLRENFKCLGKLGKKEIEGRNILNKEYIYQRHYNVSKNIRLYDYVRKNINSIKDSEETYYIVANNKKELYEINLIGSIILEEIEYGNSVEEIVKKLKEIYKTITERDIENDVKEFINYLKQIKVVKFSE
ncbi:MAG: PqqD family peptide modification chaperone [Clostridium sp.]|uniref:PqqD family peptide modification chaperone n=1 Tax=Clostridium sp. TaxID=1506 RepID=UPI003F35687F